MPGPTSISKMKCDPGELGLSLIRNTYQMSMKAFISNFFYVTIDQKGKLLPTFDWQQFSTHQLDPGIYFGIFYSPT